MDCDYDIFEILPDGASVWRGVVRGLQEAQYVVNCVACESRNECVAIHTPTKEVVARAAVSSDTSAKRKAASG